jgi:macrolide transport system ATP-binding/permease protein
MSALSRDLSYALRQLGKKPSFTAIAALTLAIGIATNTTVFSWVHGLLLEPLPEVPDQEQLFVLTCRQMPSGGLRSLSVPDLRDLQRSSAPISVLGFSTQPMNLSAEARPERVWAGIVSGNFFDALGVRTEIGRSFRAEEDTAPGASPVVVLSHAFWQRRFQEDRGLVGRTIPLNGYPFTVIGIAPPGFIGVEVGLAVDLWVPLSNQRRIVPDDRLTARGYHWLQGLARLDPGTTREQAQAVLQNLSEQLGRAYPDTNEGKRFVLYRFWNSPLGISHSLTPVLAVLGAMAVLVLLLACANVANLFLVRALGRRREVAVRLSLGASRSRLIGQFLTESVLLAFLAGAVGILLTVWTIRLLELFIPPADAPLGPPLSLNPDALIFACALSILTGLLFGLAPALQVSGLKMANTLHDEGAATSGGRKNRIRGVLVVVQVAFSCVMLIAAGLFLRSLAKAANIDTGFRARNVLLASIDLFPRGYSEEQGKALFRELLQRTAAMPGVESVSLANLVPLESGNYSSIGLSVVGYQPKPGEEVVIGFNVVGPDYFRTMGIPLVHGREFGFRDDERAPGAVVVNETMARRYWPGGQALGGTVQLWGRDRTVVGIVKDIKYQNLGEAPRPYIYLPVLQDYFSTMVVHVRTAGDPLQLTAPLRSQVQTLDSDLPLSFVRTLQEHLRIATFSQRIAATFLGSLGLLALLLSMVGLYSVIGYAVAQRTREVGVRMALGASPGGVARMVVRQGMGLALIGVVVGLAAAFGVTRFLENQLLGVSATDLAVFAGIAVLQMVVSILACYIPAREAAGVHPSVALKAE